jgi:hypothetical protein
MTWKGGQMAKSVPKKNLVSFKEILLANSIQVDALAQLLIEEGLISEQKFIAKLKQQVQTEYQKRMSHA